MERTMILFFLMLAIIAIADMKWQRIPNQCCAVILLLSVWDGVLFPQTTICQRLLGCICVSVPMLLITVLRPGAFGGGDIKLMFVSGGFLGWKVVLISTCVGVLLSGVYSGYLLAKGRVWRTQFPLGPFLCLGMIIGVLYGEEIMKWYLV